MNLSHDLFVRRRLTGIAVVLNVMLLAVHTALLAAGYARTMGERELSRQSRNLEENVFQMDRLQQTRLAERQQALIAARAELEDLEAGAPGAVSSLNVYRQAFSTASLEGAQLDLISRQGVETESTVVGDIELNLFELRAVAQAKMCMEYIARLESLGGAMLAVDNVRIEPLQETCSFAISVVARAEADMGQ